MKITLILVMATISTIITASSVFAGEFKLEIPKNLKWSEFDEKVIKLEVKNGGIDLEKADVRIEVEPKEKHHPKAFPSYSIKVLILYEDKIIEGDGDFMEDPKNRLPLLTTIRMAVRKAIKNK